MENNLQTLISIFTEYRNLLTPIEENLSKFSQSYLSVKDNLEMLCKNLESQSTNQLEYIFNTLKTQAETSNKLVTKINEFSNFTNNYNSKIEKLLNSFSRLEEKLKFLDTLESQTTSKLEKLDILLESKKKEIDIVKLQKSLENYDSKVQKVSEFINFDVAENLKENSKMITKIENDNMEVLNSLKAQNQNIQSLMQSYQNSVAVLKSVIENNEVNEAYIFEILDKWALSRKVKTK